MGHREYKKIVSGAEKAVLFIHGIVETPNHFNDFVSLAPNGMSVYNLLLDGHGKGVKDFANTSMKKWEKQVGNAVSELSKTHQQIYIVAHSMGTLFSVEQAIKNEKVASIFLIATPLRLFIKPRIFTSALKVYFDKINPDDRVMYGDQYNIELEKDGKWLSRQKLCALAFDSIGYNLKPGQTKEKTYNLIHTFDISKEGKYRITTYCFVYNRGDGGENTRRILSAEFDVVRGEGSESEQSSDTAYCGNIQTTVHFEDNTSYTFDGENSVALTDLLANLEYDKNLLCKCLPEYKVDTELGTGYGIHLDGEGYARCDKGQAWLTDDQIKTVKEIIALAKERAK